MRKRKIESILRLVKDTEMFKPVKILEHFNNGTYKGMDWNKQDEVYNEKQLTELEKRFMLIIVEVIYPEEDY